MTFYSDTDSNSSTGFPEPRKYPPLVDQLPLIPPRYHDTATQALITTNLAKSIYTRGYGVYFVYPPRDIREMVSNTNTYLRDAYHFGATIRTPVAMDCALAGWTVHSVAVPYYEDRLRRVTEQYQKHWGSEVTGKLCGGYEPVRQRGYGNGLGVTGNLRAWLEHLPDTTNIAEHGPYGYMHDVKRMNDEGRKRGEQTVWGTWEVLAMGLQVARWYVMYLGIMSIYHGVRAWIGRF